MSGNKLDIVGHWTEIKLRIVADYAAKYAQILDGQRSIRQFYFIDGFAGAGTHISKSSGSEIEGTPMKVLSIEPHFNGYFFIDLDGSRAQRLTELTKDRDDVRVYHGDCNRILLEKIFPQCRYDNYCRALCLLDPYNLNPNWEVVKKAGEMGSIEIFLNFMVMDANMNVFWRNQEKVLPKHIDRMNAFWGDDSWLQAGYIKQKGLFGDIEQKESNENITRVYQKRLKEIAGFKYVPDPIPMKNSKGSVIYYLFFASNNETGEKIAKSIMNKYKKAGIQYGN